MIKKLIGLNSTCHITEKSKWVIHQNGYALGHIENNPEGIRFHPDFDWTFTDTELIEVLNYMKNIERLK